jgi:hypothetical protein
VSAAGKSENTTTRKSRMRLHSTFRDFKRVSSGFDSRPIALPLSRIFRPNEHKYRRPAHLPFVFHVGHQRAMVARHEQAQLIHLPIVEQIPNDIS